MNNKKKRPTLATVAAQANVSIATVDRVLNARAPVNPQTSERVFRAAEAVGYFAAQLMAQRIRERLPSYRFGILLLGTAQAFYDNLEAAIGEAARRHARAHLSCDFDRVFERTPAVVAGQIERLAVQRDALAVVSFAHPLIEAAIERVRAAGVPVVALLSDIRKDAGMPYVGQDNLEVGRTMGWLVAHTCGAREGSVGVLLGGHRFLGHQARVDGLRSYLAEHAPGLRLLDALINLDNADVTEEATLDLLARHDDLRALCVAGGGGDGVISALAQLPRRPALCSILQESTSLSRQALRRGLVSLVIDSQPGLLGPALIELMVRLQTAEAFDPLHQRIHVPLQILTSENL